MTTAAQLPPVAPDPHAIVLFGATGDLAKRKLLPGLFHLFRSNLMPKRFVIIGTSPDQWSLEEFRKHVHASLHEFCRGDLTSDAWTAFQDSLRYVPSTDSGGAELSAELSDALLSLGAMARTLLYLSVPPAAVQGLLRMIESHGLAPERSRVILEKPFGHDHASAVELNHSIHRVFDESQVFRIDHFLGKEDVQNILVARFANGFFEPAWNCKHIDNVQVDVPETLGLEGRAGFYEGTGALRDMVVTHLLQVVGFVAMEPPDSFTPHELAVEKLHVFEAMRPLQPYDVVRGQYEGYRSEPGVQGGSDTETFVAARVYIDNDRWRGVPFYLRTGKRMAQMRQTVTLTFREPPRQLFAGVHQANTLSFEITEPGRIDVCFLVKQPGAVTQLERAALQFSYASSFNVAHELEAYERLLHDAMIGDRTLFTRAKGIERLWEVCANALNEPPPIELYAPGSWGPSSAEQLLGGRQWHLPE